MGGGHSWGWLLMVVAAALVASAAAQSSSGGMPPCVTKLAPCLNYLNATSAPPKSCCNPLEEAVTKERDCLCGIYKNPAILQTFNINMTQITALPKLCKIDVPEDPTALCKGTAQSPTSSSSGSAQTTPAGTGSGSGSGSGGNTNAATTNKFTQAGLLSSLVVFCAYLVFN